MFSGKLLLFLVSSCLAAPPKLTFPSFSSPVEELIEEDLVQEKVATLTATKDTTDEEQKASLKESFLDKHEKFLGLLDFDFFSSAVKTTEPENKDEKQVEKPVSGAGRQAQMANPTSGSSGSHVDDETSEVCLLNCRNNWNKKNFSFDYRSQNLAQPLAESSTSFDTLGMVSMNSAHPMISTPW